MGGYWAKGLGVFILSIVLAYSGVAWALNGCSNKGWLFDEPAAHEATGKSDALLVVENSRRTDHLPSERIHCVSLHDEINLAAGISKVFLRTDLSLSGISSNHRESSGRFFDWVFNLSPPFRSSRHLLLSVLRI